MQYISYFRVIKNTQLQYSTGTKKKCKTVYVIV